MAKDSNGKQLSTSQKSMYTPVFYTPSQANVIASSSTTGQSSGKGKEREKVAIPNLSSANLRRLEALSKRHIALQDVFEEVPGSRSISEGSLDGDGLTKEQEIDVQRDLDAGLEPKFARNPRIRHLRTRVATARQDAQDNTAHGKWELVSRLLRLGVTSGRTRWLGARADGPPPVDIGREFKGRGLGWCNAKTEAEWAEWERRYEEEVALKKRVAEWSKGVVPVAPEEGSSVTAVAVEEPPAKRAPNPLQSTGNALGFTMSKRTSALRVNGKPKHIGDITDLSMPPPSFSGSQIVTSTQIEKPGQPPATPTSNQAQANQQPPSTPPIRRTYGGALRSPSTPKDPAKSPSVPAVIHPSEPKSPSALRQVASLASLSPSNAARSRVLVPVSPSRSPRFMTALSSRPRKPTSPSSQLNGLKRKHTPESPVQVQSLEADSLYGNVSKKQRLEESRPDNANANHGSHSSAQNVTQDSLYAPSAPVPTAAARSAPYILAGFQFSTPTKESLSQSLRVHKESEADDFPLLPKGANLPTLTDLLASNKKANSPKRRKLRKSLIVGTTPTRGVPGAADVGQPGTPKPNGVGMDNNETPTKAPPAALAADSFGSIPGLTTGPSRKSPKPDGTEMPKVPSPLPASANIGDPSAENQVLPSNPPPRPHTLTFEPPNKEYDVVPDFDLDNVSAHGLELDEDEPDDGPEGVNSYEGFQLNPFTAVGIYDGVDLASPAKSLSSLAGSDSEDSEEDEDEVSQNVLPTPGLAATDDGHSPVLGGAIEPGDLSFDPDPQFASTQKEDQERLKLGSGTFAPSGTAPMFGISSSNPFLGNPALSQKVSPARSSQSYGAGLSPSKGYGSSQPSMGFAKYNSQFDVKKRVEEVDRLLGADLEFESRDCREGGVLNGVSGGGGRKEREDDIFSGWLKDVSSDEDGED